MSEEYSTLNEPLLVEAPDGIVNGSDTEARVRKEFGSGNWKEIAIKIYEKYMRVKNQKYL